MAKLPEALLGTAMVSTELLPAATGLALNVGVDPLGAPLTLSDTLPGVPDTTLVDTVNFAVPPALTVWLAGLIPIEKSLPWLGQDWVEPVAVTRSAPPAVLVLFCTQNGLTVWNTTSVEPVLRSAWKPSNVTWLPVSAMTAGRASPLLTSTRLPPVKRMLLALWMYQPYAGRVPMLFGL